MSKTYVPNQPIEDHPLEGCSFIYRADQPPYDAFADDEPGVLILGNAMPVRVIKVFRNWNQIEGLDMLAVYVPATGHSTHVTPADLGITTAV